MAEEDNLLHELGAFEPAELKRIAPALEAAGIEFEIESDHHELGRPMRDSELVLGFNPAGSKLVVFVPGPKLEAATTIVATLYPA